MKLFFLWLLCAGIALAAPARIVRFTATEDGGVARRSVLVEQGVPIAPMARAEVAHLAVLDRSNRAVPAGIEIEGVGPDGRVRWLRISLALDLQPWEKRDFDLVRDSVPSQPPLLKTQTEGERILVESGDYQAIFAGRSNFQLRRGGALLFDGPITFQLYPDARSIINAGGKTSVLSGFEPAFFRLERPSPQRAIVVLTGRYPKQKLYSSEPGQIDPKLGFDVDLRFHFSSLTNAIGFDWRLANQTGYKSWLERYALILPLKWGAKVEVAAPFVEDLGQGAGVRVDPAGLMIGGLDMPPDGSLGGAVPEIHRLFYYGMSRTFSGTLALDGARNFSPGVHLVLPAQYYSDLGILPERGDPVNVGEFGAVVERASRWLLAKQWRGTLWWGEWWREWDLERKQGTEEASNGNSLLAPLYHYMRTGDRRFLECAGRALSYVVDVQQDKQTTGFGRMMHTRRHLLDELNWIHPRYQRVFGSILASHVFLMDRERREIIATLRHSSEQIQDDSGVPHDWDEARNRRGTGETGVDTANFIEALVAGWEDTGDRFFLDRARGYTRWTLHKWRTRTDDRFWNWNLTRYVTTGLLAICRVARDYPEMISEREDFLKGTLEISRHTISHPEYGFVPGTIGEGGLHYFFYHAWLESEVSRLANDPSLIPPLVASIRKELVRQDSSGAFPMNVGSLWSQYPTRVISYYDPKAITAYLPVLGARLTAMEKKQ